jgi:steroid delta-isomerase-like uncharacterized protein
VSAEERRAEAKRNIEAYNEGHLDVLDEFYAADFVRHVPPFPDIEGLEALKQSIVDVRNAFPDRQLRIDELIVEVDTVAMRWTWRGTHTGQSVAIPIPPTGKQVVMTGCTTSHFVGGKRVEEWEYGDYVGLLQQLGLVPALGEGGG